MKFVFASYVFTKDFNNPEAWLTRINAYAGIMEALGKKNEVTSIEQISYEGIYFTENVAYHFLHFSKNALRFFPRELHHYIKYLDADIVVIQGLLFPLQIIQLRLLLGSKAKIIVQNHAEKPFTGIKKYLQKLADRCVNAYLFASRSMGLEWVAAGNLASPEKIHEVMEVSSVFYPVDRRLAKAETGADGSPVFLWVGRLNDNKDPLTVVSAFLAYAKSRPTARLYMIYQTEELLPKIREMISRNPDSSEAIILIGKVPHAELLYWFNSADVILSGSHYEGSGTSVCEGMSCGCVPVVTDILSFRMITDQGDCGILYEPGNAEDLLAALRQLDDDMLVAKRELSLKYYRENLSFEAIAQQIQTIAASL